jgi:HEAT repeat protein
MRDESSRPRESVASLVHGLDDLRRGPEIQLLLIAMSQDVVEPLGEFLLGPPALHPQPRVLAAETLGAIGGPAATRILISALGAGDLASLSPVYRFSEETVRNRVAQELGRLDDETPRSVARRAACARLLGEITDSRAEAPLLACLVEHQSSVSVAAAVALARLRGERAGPEVVLRLIEGLHAQDVSVVDECSDALVSIGAEAVPLLGAAFRREAGREETRGKRMPGPAVRAMAHALGQMDEEALSALVDHPRSFVRALALANLGHTDPEWAAPIITRALRDADRRVRRTAVARLKQLGVRRHA